MLGLSGMVYKKRRPKRYTAKDAAFAVGGHKGGYIAFIPKDYPLTSQQSLVKKVARECGIKPGIKKAELQKAMVDCVGPKMAK
ncbi:unnamed protein product [marine sediment metagenome]|uniref:Uncharacterized protein n=1 Tax=marine sediment metagenome TaxID=412755 RepID=X1U4Q8_9ZZZZ